VTKLEAALLELTSFLGEERLPYMVIGGFANLHWGVRRFTEDIDLTVQVADEALPGWIEHLARRYAIPSPDPLVALRKNHFVQIETPSGVPADLMVAMLPYQFAAIARSATVFVAGHPVRICTAEDLIIHKLTSERPLDHADVEGVILQQRTRLDRAYLDRHVRDLAAGLERPSVLTVYAACLKRAGLPEHPPATSPE